jgi:hypothetical protein
MGSDPTNLEVDQCAEQFQQSLPRSVRTAGGIILARASHSSGRIQNLDARCDVKPHLWSKSAHLAEDRLGCAAIPRVP